jgi:hypothetical protein
MNRLTEFPALYDGRGVASHRQTPNSYFDSDIKNSVHPRAIAKLPKRGESRLRHRCPQLRPPRSRETQRIGRLVTIAPRGLSRAEAAAFVGLSLATFDKARRDGRYPGPSLPGGRYDRVALELAMDRISAIEKDRTSALDEWRLRHGARSD